MLIVLGCLTFLACLDQYVNWAGLIWVMPFKRNAFLRGYATLLLEEWELAVHVADIHRWIVTLDLTEYLTWFWSFLIPDASRLPSSSLPFLWVIVRVFLSFCEICNRFFVVSSILSYKMSVYYNHFEIECSVITGLKEARKNSKKLMVSSYVL